MIYIETGATGASSPTALYENLLTEGTLTGTGSTGFEISNAVTGATWDFWRPPSAVSAFSVGVSLSTQEAADCAVIAAHDAATVGADIRVQYSTDGGTTWLDASSWVTPTDNDVVMILFPSQTGNAWRLQQRNGPAAVGVVMIGSKLAFEYGVDGSRVGFQHGHKVEVMGGDTLGGQFVPQKVRKKGGQVSVTFPWITSAFADNTMAMFEDHYNDGKPFAFAGNPSYDAYDVAYCWRGEGGGELAPSYIEGGIAAQMTMRVSYYVGT